jgi:FAD:protein FMN transferase
MPAERRFHAMGTDAQIVVVGGTPALLDDAVARVDQLERRWSRFLPNSEVSRLNAMPGEHVLVSSDTIELVSRATEGWERTGGVFDPTVLPALRAYGYDRDFADVAAHALTHRARDCDAPAPAPGCAGIECDPRLATITLPAGVEIDPGGIGKGLAADIVTAELLDAGAAGALVNLGGDLRVRGEPPNGDAWSVAVDDPARPGVELFRFGIVDGAVATSSRVQRRWQTAEGEAHHLIAPAHGRPAATRYATVTAVANDGWWAEVVTKAVLVGGLEPGTWSPLHALVGTVDDAGNLVLDPRLVASAA